MANRLLSVLITIVVFIVGIFVGTRFSTQPKDDEKPKPVEQKQQSDIQQEEEEPVTLTELEKRRGARMDQIKNLDQLDLMLGYDESGKNVIGFVAKRIKLIRWDEWINKCLVHLYNHGYQLPPQNFEHPEFIREHFKEKNTEWLRVADADSWKRHRKQKTRKKEVRYFYRAPVVPITDENPIPQEIVVYPTVDGEIMNIKAYKTNENRDLWQNFKGDNKWYVLDLPYGWDDPKHGYHWTVPYREATEDEAKQYEEESKKQMQEYERLRELNKEEK